jgi:hypothetical protein
MATIPSGTKFIGLAADYQTVEKRSKIINSESEAYTIEDIQTQTVTTSAEFQTQGTDINSTAYLPYGLTHISSVPTVTDYACHLPNPPIEGRQVVIVNTSGIDIVVYPSLPGGTINGITNGSFTIPSNGQAYTFFCYENPAPGAWTITAPATAQVTSGVIDFPQGVSFVGDYTPGYQIQGQGYKRLSPSAGPGITPSGTYNIYLNGNNYVFTFNNSFSQSVIDFVNLYASDILNDAGIVVTYDVSTNPYIYFLSYDVSTSSLLNGMITSPGVPCNYGIFQFAAEVYSMKGFCLANNTPDTGTGLYGKSINLGLGGSYFSTQANYLDSPQFTYVGGGNAFNPDYISVQPAPGTTWKRLTKVKIYTNMQLPLNVRLGASYAARLYTQGANPTFFADVPYNSAAWNNSTGYSFIYPGTDGTTFPLYLNPPSAVSLSTLCNGNIVTGVLPGAFVESVPGSNCSANVGDPGTYYIEATLALDAYPNYTNWIGITKVATQNSNPYDAYYCKLIYPVVDLQNPDYFTYNVPGDIEIPKFQIFYEYEQL